MSRDGEGKVRGGKGKGRVGEVSKGDGRGREEWE